jgi:hypothetical protein
MKLTSRSWAVFFCSVLLVLGLVSLLASQAVAQEKTPDTGKKASTSNVIKDNGKQGASGQDNNVKTDAGKNDKTKTTGVPHKGAGSRGSGPYACNLHVDNRTNWYIKIYVDGNYAGAVGPAGDLYLVTGNGDTAEYGRADFEDGSYLYWGPRTFTCGSSDIWRLWP